jgi:hypothetical protein
MTISSQLIHTVSKSSHLILDCICRVHAAFRIPNEILSMQVRRLGRVIIHVDMKDYISSHIDEDNNFKFHRNMQHSQPSQFEVDINNNRSLSVDRAV